MDGPRPRALSPDLRAALEEERDFLLRSLDDLEREREAGDLSADDYATLRDDYTARAASTLRALEDHEAARARALASAPPRRGRTVLAAALVVVVALGAGWAVARSAGDRTGGAQLTGEVPLTVGQRLSACLRSATSGQVLDALQCYDAVLEEQPANAEALTYRGWTLVLAGLAELGWPSLVDAVAADPTYPDARAFRALVLTGWCRPEEAAAELDALDASGALPEVRALVEQADLRGDVELLLAARAADPSLAEIPAPADRSAPDELDQCGPFAAAGVLDGPAGG